jgi:outer membrane protein OmpA-like peptidoglycan-associated protein
MRSIALASALLAAAAGAHAQSHTPERAGAAAPAGVTTLQLPAVAYGARPGNTNLLFAGTPLMPGAAGTARVEKDGGNIRVAAQFTGLQNPTAFGHEYLTYVMWAITPDGRIFNFTEIALPADRDAWTTQSPGNRSSLTIVTPLQTFALIVTAEPYYAVRAPSRVVVLQNTFAEGARPLQAVDITADLTNRGGYMPTGFRFDPVLLRSNLPLDFFQARNAMRIAQSAGAEQHASAIYTNAATQMKRAEELAGQRRIDRRALSVTAREVVQTAEDARDAAARATEAKRLEDERAATAAREAAARAQAQADLERRLRAEAERAAAAEAERKAAEAQRAAAEAERLEAERRRAEADRITREALAKAEEAMRAQQEAEARRAAALREQHAAEAEAARTRAAAIELDQKLQQAMRDREDLRARLLQQLNVILETRDTARGLVVNLSDVTFASGQAALEPAAREKLARVSGILAAHPTLRLEIEGHTDSVGSDTFNQSLSERRAEAVRTYLIQQGVPESSTSAAGFGKTRPVATNDTPQGRQLNRRVELVVSGEVIGTQGP